MIQRFVFSGSGGQGVITAAVVLAEAVLFHEGLNAVQTQVYGPEARGGSARSDVIVADGEIWFPKVLEPNVLVCLSQMAYDRFSALVRPGGVVITDPFYVHRWQHANSREIDLPLRATILELNGERRSEVGINMCLLGAVAKLIPVVRLESLQRVLETRYHGAILEANRKALHAGAALVGESVATF